MEVSSVGRSLGSLAGEFIVQNFKEDLDENSKNFYLHNLNNVIAAACLCHDIGNPAFGHSGEDAIASYFEKNEKDLKEKFTEKEWADLVNFEGMPMQYEFLRTNKTVKTKAEPNLLTLLCRALQNILAKPLPRKKDLLIVRNSVFFKVKKKRF